MCVEQVCNHDLYSYGLLMRAELALCVSSSPEYFFGVGVAAVAELLSRGPVP